MKRRLKNRRSPFASQNIQVGVSLFSVSCFLGSLGFFLGFFFPFLAAGFSDCIFDFFVWFSPCVHLLILSLVNVCNVKRWLRSNSTFAIAVGGDPFLVVAHSIISRKVVWPFFPVFYFINTTGCK